jgi:succinoglycan biosynthesis transport protein ExoP
MEDVNHGIIEYLKVFFRRKWFIIIPPFVGLVLGICTSMLLPKEYASSMKILVEEEKNDNPLLTNIAVSTSAAQRIQTIRETMLGWDSLNKLVKRLQLDKHIHSQNELEQFIVKLQKEIDFKPNGNIIEIAYIAKDPQQAQAVVKNVTDIFIGRNLLAQNQETSNAIKFIEEQLHVYLGKIKSAEIADLKDKLDNLLVDSTEMHPQVRQLRTQIKAKMDELKAQNLEYSEDAKLTADATNPMISQIQQALASLGPKAMTTNEGNANAAAAGGDKELYKVMLMDKIDTVMARDVSVNETIYNSLLQRLETAKITQRLQSSNEGTRYTIIEDARLPTKPVRPNKLLVTFIGLLLGLAVGVGLILMMEFLDKSFLDVHEASSYLNVPLLGAISKINTEESIREHKDAQVHLMFWMVAAGVLMISLTIMFVNIQTYALIKG